MKILFCADLYPTSRSAEAFINGDAETLFGDVLPLMKEADRVVVNLECALTHSDNAIAKFGPNMKADPQCINAIKAAHVTDVVLANNHVFDYGIPGLKDTLAVLDEAEIPYTGVGENDTDSRKIYYIEDGGKRIAIVNVCEHEYTYALPDRMGANPFDPFITMRDVREAKRCADFVIVVYHGGKEMCRYPSPRLCNLAHELVINGADAVLCQHSHCIGCYEEYNGAHIVYGQGNFHFTGKTTTEIWTTGMAVELDITDKVGIKFYPYHAEGITISLAKGELYDKLTSEFAERNENLKNGKWLSCWHDFCESMREVYENAANREKNPDLFAHYLDCEAHTDVWRELNKTWNYTNE